MQQNVTGAYVIIMLVYNALTWQSSCVISNNARKTANSKRDKANRGNIIMECNIDNMCYRGNMGNIGNKGNRGKKDNRGNKDNIGNIGKQR